MLNMVRFIWDVLVGIEIRLCILGIIWLISMVYLLLCMNYFELCCRLVWFIRWVVVSSWIVWFMLIVVFRL